MRAHPALLLEPRLNLPALGGTAALAAGVAAAGGALMARHGRLDTPGARSSHARPTPTGGGAAIAVGVLAGCTLLAWASRGVGFDADVATALCGALAFGLVGARDDFAEIDARVKLALSVAVSLAVALLEPAVRAVPLWPGAALPLWPALGVAGAALWLLTVTNAVNFMDGANGFAPGGLAVAFAALALGAAGGGDLAVAAVAAVALAGWLGFLPWNLAGRLFQGDAGALFGGFLFAALHLAAVGHGALPLLFGPLVLLPWLTDVLLTLLRRARGGRPLLHAHREHLYQRWLQATGGSHLALAWRNALVCAAAAAAALAMAAEPAWQGPIFAASLAALVAGWALASRRLDRVLAGRT